MSQKHQGMIKQEEVLMRTGFLPVAVGFLIDWGIQSEQSYNPLRHCLRTISPAIELTKTML